MLPEMLSYTPSPTIPLDDRDMYIRSQGYGLVSVEQVGLLSGWLGSKSVVEVFSGTGYLMYHLDQLKPQGVVYKAYDNRSWSTVSPRYLEPYFGTKKNALRANLSQFDVVMMVWPEYRKSHGLKIARKMKVGQYLIYQGEWNGNAGCGRLFIELSENFELIRPITDELQKYQIHYSDHWIDSWRLCKDHFRIYKKVRK